MDRTEFFRTLESLDESLKTIRIQGYEVSILSPCPQDKFVIPGKETFYMFNANTIDAMTNGEPPRIVSLNTNTQIAKARQDGLFLLRAKDTNFCVDRAVFPALFQKAGIGGEACFKKNGFARDLCLANGFITYCDENVFTAVFDKSKDASIGTIYDCISEKREPVKQAEIFGELEKEIKSEKREYDADRHMAVARYSISRKNGISYGIEICDSEVGACKLSIRRFMKHRFNILYLEESLYKHCRKSFQYDEIRAEIQDMISRIDSVEDMTYPIAVWAEQLYASQLSQKNIQELAQYNKWIATDELSKVCLLESILKLPKDMYDRMSMKSVMRNALLKK